MISKGKQTNMLYKFVALLFSIVLYFNANEESSPNTLSRNGSHTKIISGVSIHLLYDTDRYYIHGYENDVGVQLSSANRVQLNTEINKDTRTFLVTADLKNLGEGTHEVPLKTSNLSNALTAKLEPETITVTIEKKVTKDFDVIPVFSPDITLSGYKLKEATVSPKKVTITTGDKTLKEITQVVATINASMITDDEINKKVTVQAQNIVGQSLSIISDPVQVKISSNVSKPSKKVRLYGIQKGTPGIGIKKYEFIFSEFEAEISGPNNQLSRLSDRFAVPIDVSDITHQTTRVIKIPVEEGLHVTPKTVHVKISPVLKSSTSKNHSTTHSESTATNR